MEIPTVLIIMVLSSLQVQCKQVANVASRTGQMSRLAGKAMQKIQRMDPTILQNNLENSQLTFEKLKSSYRWFQRLREVIQKRKDENLESEVPHSSDLENLSKMVQVCRPDTKNPQDSCYSPCIKKKTDYAWCFTSSELRGTVWSPCTCKIKPAVLVFRDLEAKYVVQTKWTVDRPRIISHSCGQLFGSIDNNMCFHCCSCLLKRTRGISRTPRSGVPKPHLRSRRWSIEKAEQKPSQTSSNDSTTSTRSHLGQKREQTLVTEVVTNLRVLVTEVVTKFRVFVIEVVTRLRWLWESLLKNKKLPKTRYPRVAKKINNTCHWAEKKN